MKYTSYLALFILFGNISFSQQSNENIQVNYNEDISTKYWYYRHRLINNFVKIGNKSGESLVAAQRNLNSASILKWVDGTIYLGEYLAVLATEYKLLKIKNQHTEQTVMEMYYALEAINRLDFMADKYYGDAFYGNGAGSLNGFFVRSDISEKFLGTVEVKNPETQELSYPIYDSYFDPYTNALENTQANFEHFSRDKVVPSTYKTGMHINNEITRVERDFNDVENYPNTFTEMSQDQVINLLQGLALVKRLVYESETYNNLSFMDGETGINAEAGKITERIVGHIQNIKWLIVNQSIPGSISNLGFLVNGSVRKEEHMSAANVPGIEPIKGNWGANARAYCYGINEAARMIKSFTSGSRSTASSQTETNFSFFVPHFMKQDQHTRFFYWPLWRSQTSYPMEIIYSMATYNSTLNMNMEMYMTLAAIGNSIYTNPLPTFGIFPKFKLFINYTGKFLRKYSANFGFYHLTYLNDVLHELGNGTNGFGNFDYPENPDNTFLQLLKAAPCYGPWKIKCNQESSCDNSNILPSIPGNNAGVYWSTYNWSHHGNFNFNHWGYTSNESSWFTGEFPGLDFMLLHNLYLLTHASQIPSNFRNMIDSEVNYNIPNNYSKGNNNFLLGSQSQNTLWKNYGFNSLKIQNCNVSSDGNVYFRSKGTIELGDGVVFNEGSIVKLESGYDAYDCDDYYGNNSELKNSENSSENNQSYFIHNDIRNILTFQVHPNPHREQFTLSQTEEGDIKSYKIMDVMSRVMLSATFGIGKEASINTSNLAKGIYILHLETTQGLKAERIVKE